MTDDRFEQRLRGFLAAREPAAVSPVLRARLQSVTAESPVRSGGWIGWLGGAWRGVAGLVAVTALAMVLLAVLLRTEALSVREPGPVGGPSAPPAVPAVPFVTAPIDFFSASAKADADRRLATVYATSGIEGRLIVRTLASLDELSTPPGWPDAWRADHDIDADVIAILGVGPDGTVTCCITINGGLIERARDEGYWRPASWPDRLESQLESADRAVRDTALDRYVDGIEVLEPGVVMIRASIEREGMLRQLVAVLVGLALLAAFAVFIWARWSGSRTRPATGQGGVVDGATMISGADAHGPDADVATVADVVAQRTAPVAWTVAGPSAVPGEWRLVAAAIAALAGVLALGAWDLVRPPTAGVTMDVSAATVGLASPALPVVPLTLLATSVVAFLMVARSGGWRRRVVVGALVVLVGLAGWFGLDASRPTAIGGWIAGRGAGGVERGGGGLFDAVTYPLQPGASFTFGMTVRNRGGLPLTILGLDGVQPTEPNPYVASIVGLGFVEQATDDGFVTTLSARPEDTTVAWPLTLAPGEEMAIVMLGRADQCAEPGGTGSGLPLLHVQLTYRVLGIERAESVGLPVALFVPAKTTCTVEVGGGTVTYGEP